MRRHGRLLVWWLAIAVWSTTSARLTEKEVASLKQASEEGHADSQAKLADVYLSYAAVETDAAGRAFDDSRAFELYGLAARQGHADAAVPSPNERGAPRITDHVGKVFVLL